MFDTTAETMLDRVSEACAARDAALLVMALAVADAVERGSFAAAGLSRAATWLRAYTESSREDARRAASIGRLLACHPTTRGAVDSGVVSIGRAGVIAAAVTEPRRAAYRDHEAVILEQVARVHRVEDAEVLLAHWTAMVDQDLTPGIDTPQRLSLQHRFDGGASIRGELNALTAEVVRAGLAAFDSGPDPTTGPLPVRSLSERQADALGDLAQHALHTTGSTSDGPAHAGDDVTEATTGTPETARADRGTADSSCSADATRNPDESEPIVPTPPTAATPPAAPRRNARTVNLVLDVPTLAGRAPTDLDGIVATLDGRPIAATAAQALLCDTWIAAVLTDATGAIVDATNRTADFTDTQRRLITTRDHGCVFPGCDAPPSWCDVHHLHWRSNGGGRDLDNGALLCRRHHTLLHQTENNDARWTLHRAPDGGGWHATSPTGTTWTGHPERPGREPPDTEARTAA